MDIKLSSNWSFSEDVITDCWDREFVELRQLKTRRRVTLTSASILDCVGCEDL